MSNFDHKILDTRKNIQHIGLSCDDLTLSVVFEENNSLWIGCLDVRYFEKSVSVVSFDNLNYFDFAQHFQIGIYSC